MRGLSKNGSNEKNFRQALIILQQGNISDIKHEHNRSFKIKI